MKAIKIVSLFSLWCLCSAAYSEPLPNSASDIVEQSTVVLGQSYVLHSASQSSTEQQSAYQKSPIEINVYLPDSYNKISSNNEPSDEGISRRYPVLYLIDGGKDQDFKQIAGLGALASINPYIFQEFIVVGIKTQNRRFELTSMNLDKRYDRPAGYLGGADEFRSKIKHSVLPFVEEQFRTTSKKMVVGESLAGLFICETLLKTPDLFTDYVAISPSLWYDDRRLAKQASELIKTHDNGTRSLYLTMANEGGTMQKGLDEMLQAINKSGLKNLNTRYVDRRDNEFHWTIYHDAVSDALRWILPNPGPEYADEEDPWYLIEGANPPDWTAD